MMENNFRQFSILRHIETGAEREEYALWQANGRFVGGMWGALSLFIDGEWDWERAMTAYRFHNQ